jgi:hypothetical protein
MILAAVAFLTVLVVTFFPPVEERAITAGP